MAKAVIGNLETPQGCLKKFACGATDAQIKFLDQPMAVVKLGQCPLQKQMAGHLIKQNYYTQISLFHSIKQTNIFKQQWLWLYNKLWDETINNLGKLIEEAFSTDHYVFKLNNEYLSSFFPWNEHIVLFVLSKNWVFAVDVSSGKTTNIKVLL